MKILCKTFIVLVMLSIIAVLGSCATGPNTGNRLQIDYTLQDTAAPDGSVTVDVRFSQPQSALAFAFTSNGYHNQAWTPLSSGTHIDNFGGVETLWFDKPQTLARFKITPTPVKSRRRLSPMLTFKDGSLLIQSKEFILLPLARKDDAVRLRGQVSRWRGAPPKFSLHLKSDRPIAMGGTRYDREAKLEFGLRDYEIAYIGQSDYVRTPHYNALLDEALPPWIKEQFKEDYKKIISQLQDAWGRDLATKPDIIYYRSDAPKNQYVAHGTATSGKLLVLTAGGDSIDKKRGSFSEILQFLLAHETTHLFQTDTVDSSGTVREVWVIEGAANVMAIDVLFKSGLIDDAYAQNFYADSYADCEAVLSTTFSLGQISGSNRFYGCGGLMALMTDKLLPRQTLYDFWNRYMAAAKTKGYSSKLYFETLRAAGANPKSVDALQNLAESKIETVGVPGAAPDPANGAPINLAHMLRDAGLNPQFGSAGNLTQLDWR